MTEVTSPVCFAHDAEQARDVAVWRKAERKRLLEARSKLPAEQRRAYAGAVAGQLDLLLARKFSHLAGMVLSFYWPIHSELDLRFWAEDLLPKGVKLALPVVAQPNAPLVFRPWHRGMSMKRGFWNIPEPATAEDVKPDIVLAPVLGWDAEGYRLGYGGGYFDRTLAQQRPFGIGVGLASAKLPTIFPQDHDIPLQAIVTEEGIAVGDKA